MSESEGLVHVVDDDVQVRDGVGRLLRSEGYEVRCFPSATAFLEQRSGIDEPCCVVLDVMMPGMTGLELQDELRELQSRVPIVFVSGQGSIPMTVRALQKGATTFLEKPLDPDQLLDAVAIGVERHASQIDDEREVAEIRRRMDSLSTRERQVCALVAGGLLNKQIAARLGVSLGTVKLHRSRVMEKMAVDSLAELVRLVERVDQDDWLA